jgi:nucleotide-binding universal stress UspA family protein
MFKNVLVGVDRDGGGRDAIALSAKLVAEGGKVTFAHVYPADPRLMPVNSEYDLAQSKRSFHLLEEISEEVGVAAELSCWEASSVGRGLHELCEEAGADLLVVGSSRRGLLGRVLMRDDTHTALNGAPCAIAIAPAGYSKQPAAIREIGVGYNGSPESEHAVAVARSIAAEHGAKLSALEAVSLSTYAFLGGPAPIDDALDGLVEDARERIAALGGVEPHAVYGSPVEELTVFSASLDLLIVGSRDYGPMGRLVHGSTCGQLARTARCPLLVLTRVARTADAPNLSVSQDEREFAAASRD